MSNQRTNIPPQPLAQFQAHKAEQYFFQVIAPPAAGGQEVIVQGPNFRVPPGAQLSVRSTSVATATAGQGDVWMADQYEKLFNLNGAVMHILAGSSQLVPFAVDNLNELWFTAGDVATGGTVGITVVLPKLE